MRAKDFITEVGDNPYDTPKRWQGARYGDAQKAVTLPDGRKLKISIQSSEYDNSIVLVNFYVDDTQGITGKGDAFKIFSTVGKEIADYVRKHKPEVIAFTSSIDDDSRIKLYDRMVNSIITKNIEFAPYNNITDLKWLWPSEIEMVLDEFQDIQDQKIYLLVKE